MQIDQNNVNNVRVAIFTDQAGKKDRLELDFIKTSLSFEWEIMIERYDYWE